MNYAESLTKLLNRLDHQKISEATREILRTRDNGKCVDVVGSHENSTVANHFTSQLLLKTQSKKKCFKAISLNANSTSISINAEQYGIESLYSKQLESLATRGDLLIAFSTTGHCESMIEAVKVAKMKDCTVIVISGTGGGILKAMSDISIGLHSEDENDLIVDLHMSIVQIISNYLKEFCLLETSRPGITHPNQLNLLEIQ